MENIIICQVNACSAKKQTERTRHLIEENISESETAYLQPGTQSLKSSEN